MVGFLACFGGFTIMCILTWAIITLQERVVNRRAIKYFRVGDHVKNESILSLSKGIVLFLDYEDSKLLILVNHHEKVQGLTTDYFIKSVDPSDYVPTGKTYSREELIAYIPKIKEHLDDEAQQDLELYKDIIMK